jgi:hypothetical protein
MCHNTQQHENGSKPFSWENQGKKYEIIARMIKMMISHFAIFHATRPKNPRIIKITAITIKIIARVNNALDMSGNPPDSIFPVGYMRVVLEREFYLN